MTAPTRASGKLLGGRYELRRLVATGGMAEVWEAHDAVLERRVAVKLLHSHLKDGTSRRRFASEAIAAARLNHPNIVAVYDTIIDRNDELGDAIVMELIDGDTLTPRIASLTVSEAVDICVHVCDALHAAHASGIVHRDVKPSNVILAKDGRVLLTDFGIAKIAEDNDPGEGMFVGTPKYVAPEQVEGTAVDPRADLYSLCAVLYEIVCGQPPFSGATDNEMAHARLACEPTEPTEHRSDLPPDLVAILRRGLKRDPDERFASATQLRAALTQADLTGTAAPATAEPFHRAERNWFLPVVFVVVTAVALTVAGLLLGQTGTGRTLVDQARTAIGIEPLASTAPIAGASITAAVPFDPFGTGPQGEHNELAANAIDGDFTTAWRTEQYRDRTIGTKPGLGIYVTLDRATSVDQLIVEGPNVDWSADVYVATEPSDQLEDWGPPLTSRSGLGERAVFDLSDAGAGAVLLWFTDLGEPALIQITEIDVIPTG